MKIGVIGAGRLGLTFALLCEKNGFEVIASDVREDYVFNLNQKICITNEPMIQKYVQQYKFVVLVDVIYLYFYSHTVIEKIF